jgi:uncharacterized membrane protein YphA (DoxX/SURF4 family)
MLSFFPELLYLAPFSATLLRLSAGVALVYIGYALILHREEITTIKLPIVNAHPTVGLVWISGVVTMIDGFSLAIGLGTQLAAIVAMIVAIKHISLAGRYESLRPLPRSTYVLLLCICFSLLLTGAGPLGLDLPL